MSQAPGQVPGSARRAASGVSRIEEAFILVLAAATAALFVPVALGERRHEFATMIAPVASPRPVAAFLWSEAALVLAGAFVLAALLGWLLAELLVAMLQHVFNPPPDRLAVPWTFLAELVVAAIAGCLATAALAARQIRHVSLGAILREE
jgi:putative ABC transport system permease protein